MKSLEINRFTFFTEEEQQNLHQIANAITNTIKEKDLTYCEAMEVLRICKINFQQSRLI